MANPYIDKLIPTVDFDLVEQVMQDAIYDQGIGVKWLPKTQAIVDRIMHEPMLTSFKDAIDIDMILESQQMQYMAPNPIFDFNGMHFGFDQQNTVHFDRKKCVAKLGRLPSAGDLIYIQQIDQLFEITDMDARNPFTEGGNLYTISGSISIYAASEGTTKFDDDVTALSTAIEMLSMGVSPMPDDRDINASDDDITADNDDVTVDQVAFLLPDETDAIQQDIDSNFDNKEFDETTVGQVKKNWSRNSYDIF